MNRNNRYRLDIEGFLPTSNIFINGVEKEPEINMETIDIYDAPCGCRITFDRLCKEHSHDFVKSVIKHLNDIKNDSNECPGCGRKDC